MAKNSQLLIEEHPSDYNGYPFLTLIKFNEVEYLCIVDNANTKTIKAYILDDCSTNDINEDGMILAAIKWHKNEQKIPFSTFLTRMGLDQVYASIYKEYDVSSISRLIGPVPSFDMKRVKSIRKRRRRQIDQSIRGD